MYVHEIPIKVRVLHCGITMRLRYLNYSCITDEYLNSSCITNYFCVACEAYGHIGINLSGICLCICLSGSHSFLVVTHT